jgi:N-acetylglucosaminyl-diphospho-decaprenol L-rhamnosyltransferase
MSPVYEVIIVNYRGRSQVQRLLAELPEHVPVTIVDNSATSEPVDHLIRSRLAGRYIDAGANIGFAAAANLGARTASAPILIFVNPDCVVPEAVLQALVDNLATDEQLGSCHPAARWLSGAVQIGGGGWQPTLSRAIVHALGLHILFPDRGIWARPRPGKNLEVEWLAGGCLAIRRSLFLKVGGFDEMFFLYGEDMSLGRRIHGAGFRQVIRADLWVRHGGGSSTDVVPTWIWRQRGIAMARVLEENNPHASALAMRMVLAFGFGLRAICYQAAAKKSRAREMVCYAAALFDKNEMWPPTSTASIV